MTSSESETQLRSRKKSRTGEKAGMVGDGVTKDGKKTRGRPRVDTQDATAADVSECHSLLSGPSTGVRKKCFVLLLVVLRLTRHMFV